MVDRVAPLQVALKQRPLGAQAPRVTPSRTHRGAQLPLLEDRRRYYRRHGRNQGPGRTVDRGCVVSAQGVLALCGVSRDGQRERDPTRESLAPRV
jgi:hypothetical protein